MKKQTSILGKDTHSFINYMMSNNSTLPEIGKGATILYSSDRNAYEVIEVNENKVIIQRYNPERIDKNGMSEVQIYKYEKLENYKIIVVWKNNSWKIESEEIVFTKEMIKEAELNGFFAIGAYLRKFKPELHKEIYNEDVRPQKVIAGVTRLKKTYSKINIIFGVKEEYYDYSF